MEESMEEVEEEEEVEVPTCEEEEDVPLRLLTHVDLHHRPGDQEVHDDGDIEDDVEDDVEDNVEDVAAEDGPPDGGLQVVPLRLRRVEDLHRVRPGGDLSLIYISFNFI